MRKFFKKLFGSPEQETKEMIDQAILRVCPVQVATIADGDLLVINFPGKLGEQQVKRLKESFADVIKGTTGKESKVVVLEEGLTLGTILRGENEIDRRANSSEATQCVGDHLAPDDSETRMPS